MHAEHAPSWVAVAKSGLTHDASGGIADGGLSLRRLHGDNRGIRGCFERIDNADLVYVVNPSGYVGKSVSVDIGYAYARGKPIYASHTIDDPPVMSLLAGALTYEKLVELLKQ